MTPPMRETPEAKHKERSLYSMHQVSDISNASSFQLVIYSKNVSNTTTSVGILRVAG